MSNSLPHSDLLKKRLLEILSATQSALKTLDGSQEPENLKTEPAEIRLPRWKCSACGYRKFFTKPVNAKTAEGCPKCKGREFEPVE